MWLIRGAQMEALEKDMRRRIKQKVLTELRVERPEDCERLGEDNMRTYIARAEDYIDRYGGDLAMDLRRYVLLMLDFGENFQTDEGWAAEVFDDADIPGTSKLDVLEIYAVDRRAIKRAATEIADEES